MMSADKDSNNVKWEYNNSQQNGDRSEKSGTGKSGIKDGKDLVRKVFLKREIKERVLYPRSGRNSMKPPVSGGKPITEEIAGELRTVVFGSAATPPRGEWGRTGIVFEPPQQEFAYGLRAPRNATRGLLAVVQAHVLKHLLFDKRPVGKSITVEQILRPDEAAQTEALWTSISDIIWNVGERTSCVVVLPGDVAHLLHTHAYFQDGVTEKLDLFEFKALEDLQIFIKRYIYMFQEDPGPGSLLLLYSCVLTRTVDKVRTDMDAHRGAHLVGPQEEGSLGIVTLLLAGRATPYLHNGVVYVGDEDHYALPQWGILARSTVGLLMYEGGEGHTVGTRQPGSRLKTPALPVWVTSCLGHYGVLFNTNRELLRNYHAERRFELQYYTSGGCHVVLNVDTREMSAHDGGGGKADEVMATPLERLIHTKWQDAKITWTGPSPYV